MWLKTLRRIGCDVVLSPSCRGQGRVSHDDSFDVPQLSFILSFYLALFSTPCTSITLTGDFNRILLIPQLTLVQFHLHLLSVSPTSTPHSHIFVWLSVYPKTPFLLSIHPSAYLSAVGTRVLEHPRIAHSGRAVLKTLSAPNLIHGARHCIRFMAVPVFSFRRTVTRAIIHSQCLTAQE